VATVTQVLELPFPPSVNHYYRRAGVRTLISREGRRYRREVIARLAAVRPEPMRGRLKLSIVICPPDRRAFDLDNRLKALLDAMEHAGVYENDGQIDSIGITRGPLTPGGGAVVTVEEQGCEARNCCRRN
jgi:crossover junction endodeoxyribonuclease RusA